MERMNLPALRPVYRCPCGGHRGLELPPFCLYFGDPSHDVCVCCGFEFGNDDDPGTAPPVSFEESLSRWIADGCRWFTPAIRPAAWSLEAQIAGEQPERSTHQIKDTRA